jgi:hypothetical protein
MRDRVSADTPGRLFSAYDTAPVDTPARRAMSAIVIRAMVRSPRRRDDPRAVAHTLH